MGHTDEMIFAHLKRVAYAAELRGIKEREIEQGRRMGEERKTKRSKLKSKRIESEARVCSYL